MKKMGSVYAEIQLINADDLALARRTKMDKDEVRSINIKMLVDSGAYEMSINQSLQEYLQLPFIERRKVKLANGKIEEYDVVGPAFVKFKNRTAVCSAFVLPGDTEPLLGVIPMEEMDVLIHPRRQELIVNPESPDIAILKLK